ncbi:MAG: 30S ribosomal protein S2 [Candidatus Colwellbacteria bacterium RIFCSPLOWO2_12_FULL_43_11]|uniref:Small ribosomal subunit protein uS2 n=1 Tax=Candidatus Colwellbacteria bacterium RIFCSPLOWO2_12_FULL_43_11 TaxID=1797693 RepID=A0A1G1ZA85_9BACT|nr:MAG: 30S ribosomal protein S2 [Candidatus Colwellbacteria bacterium RIFCSPLOWO2_12_FULL_43_11]
MTEAEKILTSSTAPEVVVPNLTPEEEAVLKTMMEAGLFYGMSRSKTNPKIKEYLSTTKSGIEIINLIETLKSLKAASQILKDKVRAGGVPLIVGTTPAVKPAVKALALKFGYPSVTERWLGGTLTNFKTISSRVQYLKKLRVDKESGRLDKYTKKERVNIDREMEKLERLFSGIDNMDKLPTVAVIFDLKNHETAAQEAKKSKVTSIAISNTNCDPDLVDYPIICNDRNIQSINFIASYFEAAITEGKREALADAAKAEVKAELKTEVKKEDDKS